METPTVVVVLLDDCSTALWAAALPGMPHLRALLARGRTFDNFWATSPLCSPSRATMLTGQYVHGHGVLGNEPREAGDLDGGMTALSRIEDRLLPVHLGAAGVRTGLLGKLINGYGRPPYVHKPPGWDRFVGYAGGGYDDARYVVDGEREIRPASYSTDFLAGQAAAFLANGFRAGRANALFVCPKAPHAPFQPAERHADAPAPPAPRGPAYDEADVSDKPAWLRATPQLTEEEEAAIDAQFRDQVRTLYAVDDLIGAVAATVADAGAEDRTTTIVTSDNGWMAGQHRMRTKGLPYPAATRLPLVVAGPGVAAGEETRLATMNDLGPTIAALVGADLPDADGRDLGPLLGGEAVPWRTRTLVEYAPEPPGRPAWRMVTDGARAFVAWASGEVEFYAGDVDPDWLDNAAGTADLGPWEDAMAALAACAGDGCRAAEDAA